MWLYVPQDERQRITASMEEAGTRASAIRPLAWLRLEPPDFEICELRLRLWPGGSDRLLARSHPHGAWVEWLGA
jgi:hypothetical protein